MMTTPVIVIWEISGYFKSSARIVIVFPTDCGDWRYTSLQSPLCTKSAHQTRHCEPTLFMSSDQRLWCRKIYKPMLVERPAYSENHRVFSLVTAKTNSMLSTARWQVCDSPLEGSSYRLADCILGVVTATPHLGTLLHTSPGSGCL